MPKPTAMCPTCASSVSPERVHVTGVSWRGSAHYATFCWWCTVHTVLRDKVATFDIEHSAKSLRKDGRLQLQGVFWPPVQTESHGGLHAWRSCPMLGARLLMTWSCRTAPKDDLMCGRQPDKGSRPTRFQTAPMSNLTQKSDYSLNIRNFFVPISWPQGKGVDLYSNIRYVCVWERERICNA